MAADAAWCGLAAILLGGAVFLALVGAATLRPSNIAWLSIGDPAQHYLGWAFFRRGPWTWPPALNPDYGLELSSSIFFTDSIPLLALALKGVVPAEGPFQYHGPWLLACFVLQAFFALRLGGRLGCPWPARIALAVLLCFAPMYLWRLHGHFSLNAHWILLAGLWLCLAPPTHPGPRWAWVLLVAVAAMVHAYLMAMAFALWVADWARRVLVLGHRKRGALLAEPAAVLLGAGAALWLGGAFAMSDGTRGGGFGHYRANLLSLLDSDGWSYLWPDIPGGAGDYEGFAFLGTGGILLLAAALVARWRGVGRVDWKLTEHWPLLLALTGLALLAFSDRWALGPWELGTVAHRHLLAPFGETFRSSGRFLWPVAYAVLLWSTATLCSRLPGRAAWLIIGAAAALQVVDTAPGWRPATANMAREGTAWPSDLRNPFWTDAAGDYRLLRRVPAENAGLRWRDLSYLALGHGMGTDAGYLARVPQQALSRLRRDGATLLAAGSPADDTLYVLDHAMTRLVAGSLDPAAGHLLAEIDGMNVLAPGWLRRRPLPAGAVPIAAAGGPRSLLALAEPGMPLATAAGSDGIGALSVGWHAPESSGTWSDGAFAAIALDLPMALPERPALRISAQPLVSPRHPRQRVTVRAGGRILDAWTLTAGSGADPVEVPFRSSDTTVLGEARRLLLLIDLPDAVMPSAIGTGADARLLAIHLREITLVAAPERGQGMR